MKTRSKGESTVEYIIIKPGGNDTALVLGTNYTKEQKKIINNSIMAHQF